MKWTTVIYIVLFACLLWGVEHSRRDLWEPDEARYAYVAREMMQDGHWAVPHRHGQYYAHKPPLYFWMIRGVVKLTGQEINGVTARIPSLLATIVSLLVTGLFAVRLFGKKALWPSCLILSTSFLFWHEGGMGRMDSVLLALELSALYLLIRGDEKRSSVSTVLGYAMMGLGVLAKGPVGLLVPLVAYLVIRKVKDGKLFAAHMSWGIPLALLFPLCWLGAAWAEGAPIDYFKELIFKQNFGRVAGTASFGKPNSVCFYLLAVFMLIKADQKNIGLLRIGAYVCMGVGVVTKDPAELLVPFFVYVVIRMMQDRRAFAKHFRWGVPLLALFPLCWLVAVWAGGGSTEYLQEHILGAASAASFGKPRPVYFYLLHVPAEFMPWTLFLPAAAASLWKCGKKRELKILVGWALAVIIFFSLSSGKRNLYVLLAYPAMAIMVGGACSYIGGLSERWKKLTVASGVALMVMLGLAESSIGLTSIALPFSHILFVPSALTLLVGALVCLVVYQRKGFGPLLVYMFAGAFVLHYMLVANVVFPALNAHKTPVEVIEAVQPYSEAGEKMIVYGSTSEIMPLYCNMILQ